MRGKIKSQLYILASSALLLAAPAAAQNSHTGYSGKIKYIYLSGPNNYAYRVTLYTALPSCNDDFAYISPSDGNYDAYASLLTTAAASSRSVNIWITTDANGFCHLDELQVPF